MTDKFLSAPSARRATPMSRSICARRSKFLSTPSARRATLYNHRHAHCCQISIHALREEGDLSASYYYTFSKISIHALREEGDLSASYYYTFSKISIHALREEGDDHDIDRIAASGEISIHALREEGDHFTG